LMRHDVAEALTCWWDVTCVTAHYELLMSLRTGHSNNIFGCAPVPGAGLDQVRHHRPGGGGGVVRPCVYR
jgi:hypothetical protein